MTKFDTPFVDRAFGRLGRSADRVIPILQAIQDHYHYLPTEALRRVCEISDITPAAIAGVSTFYDRFRHAPAGENTVRVCHGTACHVKGAERIRDAFAEAMDIGPGEDTDADRRFTIEKVACLGCCTLAPVVQIGDRTYGHLTADAAERTLRDFAEHLKRRVEDRRSPPVSPHGDGAGEIRVGLGSCCLVKGSDALYRALSDAAGEYGVAVRVRGVGCVGMCHRTPLVEVVRPDREPTLYECVTPTDAASIVHRHFRPRGLRRARIAMRRAIDRLIDHEPDPADRRALHPRDPAVSAFLGPQHHVATEFFGALEPGDVDGYLQRGGFEALGTARAMSADELLDAIEASGLRGRGGAGFPAATKWRAVRAAPGDDKFVICNGDEGDPGAFMDRMLLESFPYRILEGMAIAAHAVGARKGVLYIRHEYPLAVGRVREAIAEGEARGLLGDDFRVSVFEGAGAFVCGEETALIASMQGGRGVPRRRPPYPAHEGLFGRPTLVNNVETLAMVPWIVRNGPERFAALGSAHSQGTKVFALAGKVNRGGLIEVPMGVTLRQIVDQIGGGIADGRRFKAVQIGGPSGGCVPARLADTPIDYHALREVGAIMGSGGLVVLDETDCMVDLARYFLRFTQDQSCGQCTFCRVGTRRMLDILDRICEGGGRPSDLQTLEHLAEQVAAGSLCGLGATAPNPVLTTLRYFREEYQAHLDGRCPAGRCKALIRYQVNDQCVGCTICAQHCPADAIAMMPYQPHTIDDAACTRCDTCRILCPHDAIEVH